MITKELLSSGRWSDMRKKVLMTVTGISAAAIMFASLSMSGMAAAKGTVMATAAKVRSQANTTSDSVVSLPQGTVVDIQEEVTGGDGKVWYKIVTDGGQTGYIRSDLMTKTEVEDSNAQPSGGQGNLLAPGVTAVNPVTAKVSGTQIRVRSSASTSGDIVTTLEQGVALTVLGTATDSTGKIWYQVNFNGENGVVDGFVRNDFVTLEGDLTAPVDTPIVEDPPIDMPEDDVEVEPVVNPTPSTSKDYETEYKDGEWYLNVPKENAQYKISTLFEAAQKNAELYTKSKATIKTMKYVMGGLILLAAAAVIGATMVLLRFKDLKDALEFGKTERETIEERRTAKAQRNRELREKEEKRREAGENRPKPQGQAPQGRPQGQAPQGRPQGQAPQGRPQGQAPQGRPQGQAPQGRPQGQAPQGRPQGQAPQKRPATTDVSGNPVNQSKPAANVQARPAAPSSQQKERVLYNEQIANTEGAQAPKKPAPQGQRPQGQAPQQKPQQKPQQAKPKNFLEDDDEFEFEFLNWDGDNK